MSFLRGADGGREEGKPFALFVCYNPPHSPYYSREDTDYEAYDRFYSDAPPESRLPRRENVTLAGERFEENARVYFSHISGIDRCVGRLLTALEEVGCRDNTLVVYTSDHGEMLGSHGLMSKNVPYEEATAIPFLVRCPSCLGHRVEPLMITAVDIMPTVLGLAGIEAPTGLAGTDYSELLVTGEGCRPLSALFTQPSRKGVRTHKHLLTVAYKSSMEYGEIMLFDIERDPYQKSSLPPTDITEEELTFLRRELGAWLAKSNDPWYKARLYSDFIIYP